MHPGRSLNVILALIAVCGVIALALAFGLIRSTDRPTPQEREQAAEQLWRREFGDPAELLAAFPATTDNEAAAVVTELSRTLDRDAGGAPAAAIRTYVVDELARLGGQIAAPPPIVRTFLDAHRGALDAVVDIPATAGPIVWRRDLSRSLGELAPDTRLFGLHRMLMARALSQWHAGDASAADRTLLAGWALVAGLRERPDVTSQLLAVSLMHGHSGALRRVPVNPAPWRRRLAEHDFRASYLTATRVDARVMLRELSAGTDPGDRLGRADFLEATVPFLVEQRDAPIDDEVRDGRKENAAGSPGAILAEGVKPGILRGMVAVTQLMVELELLDRVLDAREQKARLGRWPAALSQSAASRLPGAAWLYAVTRDGRLTIAFRRRPGDVPTVRFDSTW
jgi:hypothetical protein